MSWSNASKWGFGANLLGMGLNAFGGHRQEKANNAAMDEANAAMDKYNMDMQAYNDAQSQAAHGAAMAEWQAQRDRELAMLKDQGATMDELYAHDQQMGEDFMEQVAAFGPEQSQEAIDANTAAANEEQTAVLDQAQAEQGEVTAGSSSFQEAAAEAMAGANENANANSGRMAGLTGVTRMRDGEDRAGMQMGVIGSSGERAKDYITKMGEFRQRRLGYAPPRAPSGPRDTSGMPQEPDMEIQTSNKGNWMSALGSMLSSGAGMFNNWNKWQG
jgi:hypothetical protein